MANEPKLPFEGLPKRLTASEETALREEQDREKAREQAAEEEQALEREGDLGGPSDAERERRKAEKALWRKRGEQAREEIKGGQRRLSQSAEADERKNG